MDISDLLKNPEALDALIKKVAEEVIRRMKNRPKRALVLFSGAAIGYCQAMECLEKLKADGWEMNVYLSEAASRIFTPENIQEKLGVDRVYTPQSSAQQHNLYKDVDQIILATTTVNTAAKIACGICDNELTTLLNHGMMAGTDIVCAVDGACPDNKERASLGMGKSPESYRQRLKDNLRAMMSYGMRLCAAEDLYDTCTDEEKKVERKEKKTTARRDTSETERREVIPEEETTPVQEAPGSVKLDKHVISSQDIRTNRKAKQIIVPQDALITQSAADVSREFGIGLIRG